MAVGPQETAPPSAKPDNEADPASLTYLLELEFKSKAKTDNLPPARSASEVRALSAGAPLRKSASGATFARLRVMPAPETTTSSELPSPRVQTEIDASYASYDVTNTKNVGNHSPVSLAIITA